MIDYGRKVLKSFLFTVIVPMYNVEEYIEKCILSVINQTYQNWELILIDDESTDYSCQIAKKYADLDDRIKLIMKKHGGLPQTRNYGLRQAKGEYIALLDGDDYWANYHLEELSKIIGTSNCDMCIGNNHVNFTEINQKRVELFPYIDGWNEWNLTKKLSHIFCISNLLPASAVLTTYRADYLKENCFEYSEELKCSEDLDFFLRCISNVNCILFFAHEFYYYRQDNSKAMTRNITGEMLCSRLKVYFTWYDYYGGKKLGDFDCVNIQRVLAHDVTYNIVLYHQLSIWDHNKREVWKMLFDNRDKWCDSKNGETFIKKIYLNYYWKAFLAKIKIVNGRSFMR